MLQTVTSRGRPPLGQHAMPEAIRKAKSRTARQVAQLNVDVPVAVRDAVRELAQATDRTQAEILAAAIAAYLDSHATER